MTRSTQQQKRNNMTRAKGVGSNTAVVTSRRGIDLSPADGNGVLYGFQSLDPLNASAMTAPVVAIAGAYEYYRIRSATVKLISIGGNQAPGWVTSAYIDNPELMTAYINGSGLVRSTIVTNEQNSMSQAIVSSGQHTHQNNRVVSRQWYSCNALGVATSADFDRSVQSLFAYRVGGVAPSVSPPVRLEFIVTFEFKGLGTTASYTLQRHDYSKALGVSDPWALQVPYAPEQPGNWPSEVKLVSRDAPPQVYVMTSTEPEPEVSQ